MEVPAPVIIPTKDRKQAMDWSLALTSQGIGVAIVQLEEERFALQVSAADSVRAFQTLKLYHQENRGWGWWVARADEGPRFEPRVILWVTALLLWYAVTERFGNWKAAGMLDSNACLLGDWWRLFTAVTLHHDLAHLAGNCAIGLLLFGLAGARYGLGLSLLAAYLAGVIGNFTGLLVYEVGYRSLGASGMVMGALGLLIARPAASQELPATQRKRLVVAVSVGAMLFVLLGVSGDPQTDMVAHLAGFAAGLFFGWFLRRLAAGQTAFAQVGALCGFILLLALTWGLALR
jgi:rhomboid protease GluP